MSRTSGDSDADLEIRLALVEKDFGTVNEMFRKSELAIEKMTEVSVDMKQLLAIHETRLNKQDEVDKQLIDSVERRRDEQNRRDKESSERLEKMSSELRLVIREEVGDLKVDITAKLTSIQTGQENLSKELDDLEKRIQTLERWRWGIVGGSAVLGFIVSKLPELVALFTASTTAAGM